MYGTTVDFLAGNEHALEAMNNLMLNNSFKTTSGIKTDTTHEHRTIGKGTGYVQLVAPHDRHDGTAKGKDRNKEDSSKGGK
jgi:hypothetical protein